MSWVRRVRPVHVLLGAICAALLAMWIYAFFFASKESVNKINDREWTKFATGVCAKASDKRDKLTDLSRFEDTPEALAKRAELVDKATDTLSDMISTLRATPPTDEKGAAIVPLWLDEYETYIDDRRDYTDALRAGSNKLFAETAVEGLPITERLSTFAADNLMSECSPPTDLDN